MTTTNSNRGSDGIAAIREDCTMKTKDEDDKPRDPVRELRDLAANVARAIDFTAFRFEAEKTSDLTARVAALVGLKEWDNHPEISTAKLRERLALIRKVANSENYQSHGISTETLKARLSQSARFTQATKAIEAMTYADLVKVRDEAAAIINEADAEAKREAKRVERQAKRNGGFKPGNVETLSPAVRASIEDDARADLD